MKKTLFISLVLLFIGCSDNKVDDSKKDLAKQNTKEIEKVETPAALPSKTTENKETVPQADKITEVKKVPKIEDTKNEIDDEVKKVLEAPVAVSARSGKDIYQSCTACHGQNAEKKALGKSQVIRGWSAAKIEAALNGYIDGSYGGTLKSLMKGQSSALTAEDRKAVAEYISKL